MKGPSKTRRTLQLEREFGRRLRACRIVAGYEEASDFAADLGITVLWHKPTKYDEVGHEIT